MRGAASAARCTGSRGGIICPPARGLVIGEGLAHHRLAVTAIDSDVRLRTSEMIVPFFAVIRMSRRVTPVIGEALAAKIRLGQPVSLDHRPHRSVEDEDAVLQ